MESLLNYYGVDLVAATLMFLSIYQLGKKKKSGFIFGMGACLGWMIFGVIADSWPNIIVNGILIVLNFKGFHKWNKAHKADDQLNNKE